MEESWEYKEVDSKNCDEVLEAKKEKIAQYFLRDYLTDDNPSHINGLTGLEQVFNYEFYFEDKAKAIITAGEILKIAQNMKVFESEEEKIGEEKAKLLYVKLAKGIYRGILTDDNYSKWNGLTGLEQAISYEFGRLSIDKMYKIKDRVIYTYNGLLGGFRLKEGINLNSYVDMEL